MVEQIIFPDHVIENIFSFSEYDTRVNISKTCKKYSHMPKRDINLFEYRRWKILRKDYNYIFCTRLKSIGVLYLIIIAIAVFVFLMVIYKYPVFLYPIFGIIIIFLIIGCVILSSYVASSNIMFAALQIQDVEEREFTLVEKINNMRERFPLLSKVFYEPKTYTESKDKLIAVVIQE